MFRRNFTKNSRFDQISLQYDFLLTFHLQSTMCRNLTQNRCVDETSFEIEALTKFHSNSMLRRNLTRIEN